MKAILGIDIGTSGVKVLAVDENLKVIASSVTAYPLYSPEPGWSEQNPSDWWSASYRGLKQLTSAIKGYDIAAVGLSGQMHGMVALDCQQNVIRPAILWNDQRTAKQCDEIISTAGGIDCLTAYTNNTMLTGFTGGKILWMKENEPENYARTQTILNPKDYIVFRLTGVIGTDVSDASGTGLYDVKNNRFCTELIEKCGLEPSFFAPVHRSSDFIGRVTEEAEKLTGIPKGTPVSAGGGDAVLSTIAMGATDENSIAVMLGTSGVVSLHTPDYFENHGGKVQFSRACVDGLYHIMGVTLAAAGSYQWYGETLGTTDFRAMDAEAAASNPGANGILYLPYLYGERCPINDPTAKGAFIGISAANTKGDFTRSVLEGVAYSLYQVFETISEKRTYRRMTVAGGGSKSRLWLQIFADVFGMETVTLDGAEEGSGFGAAIVAAIGCGLTTASDAAGKLTVKSVTEPIPENREIYRKAYEKYVTLYRRLQNL